MDEKQKIWIDNMVNYIESSMALHNGIYPEAKVTIEDVVNHLKAKRIKKIKK